MAANWKVMASDRTPAKVAAERPLPPTSYAILGVLSFLDEMSGYDVRKYADASIAWFYWSPAPSQVYAELRRLRDRGLVDERKVAQDALRNKRVYRLTESGREALRSWIGNGHEGPILKHSPMLRLWAGHNDPAALGQVLDDYESWCRDMLEHLKWMRDEAEKVDAWRYPAVVARWGVRHYEAELGNVEAVRVDLKELEERRPSRTAPSRRGNSPKG